jgi:hypothetical protein
VLKMIFSNIFKMYGTPDGVTRHTASLTHGHALSAGLTANGSHPRTSINNGGSPSQGSYDGEVPSSDNLLLPRVQSGHGFGRTDFNGG